MEDLRRGIGAIVLDKDSNIIAFQRKDSPENWQSLEGGIDGDETPVQALSRELKEEIDINKEDYDILSETKDFITYIFPKNIEKTIPYAGQTKKFFLIKLKKEIAFDFEASEEEAEFINYKIVEASELISLVPQFKKATYLQVLKEFKLI